METVKVAAADLHADSVLNDRIAASDFVDCYCVTADMAPRRAAEVITDFPGWGRFLLKIRRLVTTPFGLSNDGPASDNKVGIFPVEIETPQELVAGFNDRHLDFRVSVMSRDGQVFLATWVHPHNFGGRLYLKLIMPFHILLSRNALTRVAKAQG